MANTIARSGGAGGGSFDFIKILLRGTGQVMFQNSAWTGLLFMIGIFWGAYAEGQGLVGWGALLGVTVSTVTGYLLGFPAKDGEQGLWGFNGVLVGCVSYVHGQYRLDVAGAGALCGADDMGACGI